MVSLYRRVSLHLTSSWGLLNLSFSHVQNKYELCIVTPLILLFPYFQDSYTPPVLVKFYSSFKTQFEQLLSETFPGITHSFIYLFMNWFHKYSLTTYCCARH